MKAVAVFCGSSFGTDRAFSAAAHSLGAAIGERGLRLIYGGGNIGLMGAVADAALQKGGEVVGIIPDSLVRWEVAHNGLTRLEIVASMHERKARMAELADAFLILPGGFGTMEETFEVITWAQLGLHRKACGFLNVNGFFDPLFDFMRHMRHSGFIREEHFDLFCWSDDHLKLLQQLESFVPPNYSKFVPDKKPQV
jgi:hypothetical protein